MSMYHLYFEKEKMKRNSINQNIEVECFTIPSACILFNFLFFFFSFIFNVTRTFDSFQFIFFIFGFQQGTF